MADDLAAQVAALQAQVAALVAAQGTATPAAVWPQYVTTNGGVTYQVYAPLNPAYGGSLMDSILGKAPHFIFEPSNGQKINAPLRSPNGWPLFYVLDGNGKQVGPALVLYGGQTFKDDAAVADYLARVAASQPDPTANAQAWANLYADRAADTPTNADGKHKNKTPRHGTGGHSNKPTTPVTSTGTTTPPASDAPPVIVNQ